MAFFVKCLTSVRHSFHGFYRLQVATYSALCNLWSGVMEWSLGVESWSGVLEWVLEWILEWNEVRFAVIVAFLG